MPGEHDGVLGQNEQPLADALHLLVEASARKIGAADRASKERISAEEHAFGVVTHAARRVTGRRNGLQLQPGNFDDIAFGHELVWVGRPVLDIQPEPLRSAFPSISQQVEVSFVQKEPGAGGRLHAIAPQARGRYGRGSWRCT